MHIAPRWIAAWIFVVHGACSVTPVTFTGSRQDAGQDATPDARVDARPDATADARPDATCGNGAVELGEECDDGDQVNGNACDNNCTRPRCGNGELDPAEECDDGNAVEGDACDTNCTTPRCSNGVVDPGEDCDQAGQTAACLASCQASRCGDGVVNVLAGEEVDQGKSPSQTVPVDASCRYDFTAITQLFCAGACGAWGGGDGCQQEDADALCKLRTGNPGSVATSFTLGVAQDAPGICCPDNITEQSCVMLRTFDDRGVANLVWVNDVSLRTALGPGRSITSATCSDP